MIREFECPEKEKYSEKMICMKKIKIVALLIAMLCVLCCALVSCSSPLSDEELIAVFKETYKEAVVLNEYIWGKGIEPLEYDGNVSITPYYVAVSSESPYKTVDEFKSAIQGIYVSDLTDGEISEMLFVGYGDDGPKPRYSETDGVLTVDVKYDGFDLLGRFDPETARVKRARGNTVVFTVTYTREGKSWDEDVMMRLEGETWKFEAPTY